MEKCRDSAQRFFMIGFDPVSSAGQFAGVRHPKLRGMFFCPLRQLRFAGRGCVDRNDFVRYALIAGLEEEERIGVNPFRFGFAASKRIGKAVVRNRVRPRGLRRLGQPCHLTGTGMAFPWEVLPPAVASA